MARGHVAGEGNLVLFFDVDNTLLDNDRLKSDLAAQIRAVTSAEQSERFWRIYEEVRRQQQYVDYPTTLQRWIIEVGEPALAVPVHAVFDHIDFASYVYPDALKVLAYCGQFGTTAVLSDGDQVFQRRKIEGSGIASAVENRVMITIHKQEELADVFARYPADHYVMVDDKMRILSVLEESCAQTFTTVHVLQGHYAHETGGGRSPDFELEAIGQLCQLTEAQLRGMATTHSVKPVRGEA